MQHGEFTTARGMLSLDPDKVENSTIEVTIDTASISTGFAALDDHLKNADFFEVEKYPTITFESTGVRRSGVSSIVMTGDLTIKDITKPVELDVNLNHIGAHPLADFFDKYKGEWIGITANGSVLRSDFDLGLGAPLTGDLIRLEIFLQMKARES